MRKRNILNEIRKRRTPGRNTKGRIKNLVEIFESKQGYLITMGCSMLYSGREDNPDLMVEDVQTYLIINKSKSRPYWLENTGFKVRWE